MEEKSKKEEKKEEKISVEDLKKQLEECQKTRDEYLEGWKRERAGFLNYKKDEMERIEELIKYANEELILKMLPILDNFEVAKKNIPEDLKKDEHIKGLLQINQQMRDFLKTQGIEEIKSVGEKFNPNFHESVGQVVQDPVLPEGSKRESGVVVEETQKGYMLYDKVIRPAKVKITK